MVVADDADFADKLLVGHGFGCAKRPAGGHINHFDIGIPRQHVLGKTVSDFRLILVLKRSDNLNLWAGFLEVIDRAIHSIIVLGRTEISGDHPDLAFAAGLLLDELANFLAGGARILTNK